MAQKSDHQADDAIERDGYVSGILYPRRYYRELNPAGIAFAALQAGYVAPRLDQPFRYLDLGCAHGYSTTLFAALFPRGEFIGIDLDPAHIASAEGLRAAAQLENLRFVAESFATMAADEAAPRHDCDYIVLHGVMSWVSAAVQRDVMRIVDQRLKPGGIVYVSYNCQPGWAVKMPLRELLLDVYDRTTGDTVDARLQSATRVLRQLADTGAHYVAVNPAVAALIEMIESQQAGYLAHEFLNRHWTAFHFRDLSAQLRAANLTYIGAANAADNISLLAVPAQSAALMAGAPDMTLRETLRDMALNRQFRRDLYGRALRPLSLTELVAAWRETSFVAALPREECALVIQRSFGDVTLDPAIFAPLLDRLAAGPAGFDELCAIGSLRDWEIADQLQAIQILVGADFVRPLVAGAAVAIDTDAVSRFNAAALALAHEERREQIALANPAWSDARVVPVTAL